jgi:hypothetical protein
MVKKRLTPCCVDAADQRKSPAPSRGGWVPGMRRKSGAIGAAASIGTSCDCDSGYLRARPLQAYPMHAPRVEQPVVHDLPLVPASSLEIQQCGSLVLQLYKELQRIPTGRPAGIDGLRLDPLVPFPDDQTPRSFLLHRFRQTQKDRPEAVFLL